MKNILLLIIIAVLTVNYINKENYVEIPSTSIRLRVIAASNDKHDQEDKMVIKEALTSELQNIIGKNANYNDVDKKISVNVDKLNDTIENAMKVNNIDSKFTLNYGLNYFPEKTYKGVTYSAGNYQSLVVKIGEGEGENWWCALYPPLCQIDENTEINEYRSLIKDILSQYN